MPSVLADLLTFPLMLIRLAVSALGFSGDAFLEAAGSAEAQTAALVIAFLAGVSEMLGQSVILVVNRIPLYRFLASLAFTGATYLVTVAIWGLAAIAIAPLTRVGALEARDLAAITGILGLAFAPRILGVLSIAPYIGAALGNVLEAWSMGLAIFGLHVGLDLPLGAAVACGGAGWAASYVLRGFLGRLLARPLGALRNAVSGSALDKSPQQILDDAVATIARRMRP